jgi:hypothetical protein
MLRHDTSIIVTDFEPTNQAQRNSTQARVHQDVSLSWLFLR